ncbi:bifunctional acetate--CoA ligase family protein/GNAT family N-acetyltransferase [Salinicola halophilus]|uniref:bifunctional acetate--CoA ligase family protein/GNAT family N-acetyltransferase n=1 Tax=Salinicola halophilus TaxID=184065 RepID=UPI000DA12ED6|nr:bifunctional acetate--CoA ligase family protein/GNAT family N-acetyltransferase [Salinicola halophilus]
MATQFLRRFFAPRSIVVVGASPRADSLGAMVLSNVLRAGFPGSLWCTNPRGYADVEGVTCYRQLQALPAIPELAVICTPLARVPTVIRQLGELKVKAALILSGGASLDEETATGTLREQIQRTTRQANLRVLGPECLGVAVPSFKLNATYASQPIADGSVAYLGQSGMLGNAMIDWAAGREVGFSHLVTLGDSVDVRLPDVIDYLNTVGRCRSLLLHLERIADARHFMTALREASRNRLVLAIKSGRTRQATLEPLPDTPGIERRDDVVEAALARAGVVRVEDSDELFDALETLSRFKPPRGDRLAIVSNGVGPALLAIDKLIDGGGQLATFGDATANALRATGLDVSRPGRNPVDLGGSARPAHFLEAIEILARDSQVDAVLVLHAPTRLAPSLATAQTLIGAKSRFRHRLLVSWMGLKEALDARSACNRAGIPTYISPEKAVRAFLHLVRYRRVQHLLHQTPPSLALPTRPETRARCDELIESARAQGRDHLSHEETAQALNAYGIRTTPSVYVDDFEQAERVTVDLPGPWAVKAVHRDSCLAFQDGRGNPRSLSLVQDLEQPGSVVDAVVRLGQRLAETRPESPLYGYCLQTMQRGKDSLQLCAGITRDAEFGPVIVFGTGGYRVDVMSDRQIALPPLNQRLAEELIDRTRAGQRLRNHGESDGEADEPLGNAGGAVAAVARLLVQLSQLASDQPHLRGLEINPLLVNREGVTAIDFALDLGEPAVQAIMPYPERLREQVTLGERLVDIRPIRGEDAPLITAFHARLSEQSIRYRYFHHKAVLTPRELAQLAQINYDRQMAFIAVAHDDSGDEEMLGVVRVWNDADNIRTEFSIIIRDDCQGIGLGRALMEKMIRYSRDVGTLSMVGTVLIDNRPMRQLLAGLGFRLRTDVEEGIVEATYSLNDPVSEWQRHRLANAST